MKKKIIQNVLVKLNRVEMERILGARSLIYATRLSINTMIICFFGYGRIVTQKTQRDDLGI